LQKPEKNVNCMTALYLWFSTAETVQLQYRRQAIHLFVISNGRMKSLDHLA